MHRKGFTLVELLLVVGILAVVFGLALPFALNTKFTNELDTAAENLRTTLREAQSQAVAAEGDTPYGVYFDTVAAPPKYTIYKGTSYTDRDTSFNAGGYGTTELSKSISATVSPSLNNNEISFDRLTGRTGAASIKSVQKGTSIISAGSAMQTVAISSVDMSKSFLVFGTSFNDASPEFSQISGQITDPAMITFARQTAPGSPQVNITWYVVEFTEGVAVQRGSTTFESSTSVTATIPNAIDMARGIPLISFRKQGSVYDGNEFVNAKITNPTTLELTRNLNSSLLNTVEWQVVQFDRASVQTGDISFGVEDGSKPATINSIDTTKSWLMYSYKSNSSSDTNIGQKLVRGVITSSTVLTFDRDNTGQIMDITWYLVEFKDGTAVQSGSANFNTTDTQKNIPITAVDTGKSFAAGGYMAKGGKSSYLTSDNPGVGWMRLDIINSTNLQIKRDITGNSTADIGWFVVDFYRQEPAVITLSIPDIGSETITVTPEGLIY